MNPQLFANRMQTNAKLDPSPRGICPDPNRFQQKKKRKRFFQRRDFRFYKLDKKKFSAVGTNDVDVGGPQHIPIQIFVTSDEFKAVKHDGNAMPQ